MKEENLEKEFNNIISDIISDPTVEKMKLYRQHYDTSCFEHCYNVALYSFIICKKLHLDYKSAARAGMLHDLFLYDWRKKRPDGKGLHAFRHPRVAFNNASKIFDLNKKEKDIILKHMWPLTVVPPRYLESLVISSMDKYSALKESYDHYLGLISNKRTS